MNEALLHEMKIQFDARKSRNPRYSLRQYAKELELAPGEISEFLKKKRRFSSDKAQKIVATMKIPPYKKAQILRRSKLPIEPVKEIGGHDYNLIANPIHFTYLTLMTSPDFESDPNWAAEKLGVKVSDIYQVIYRLKKSELIDEVNGKLVKKHKNFSTTDDIPSQAIRDAHKRDLKYAEEVLDNVPIDLRDFSSMNILLDPKKLPLAKQILRKAQDDIESLMKDTNSKDVYKICTYLFPVTSQS